MSSYKIADQNQVEWGFEKYGLEYGIPVHGRSVGTRLTLRSLVIQIILWIYKTKKGFFSSCFWTTQATKCHVCNCVLGDCVGDCVVDQCSHNEGIAASQICWCNCWRLTILPLKHFLLVTNPLQWVERREVESLCEKECVLPSWCFSAGEVPLDPVWLSAWNLKLNCLICLPYNYLHFLCFCHHFSS